MTGDLFSDLDPNYIDTQALVNDVAKIQDSQSCKENEVDIDRGIDHAVFKIQELTNKNLDILAQGKSIRPDVVNALHKLTCVIKDLTSTRGAIAAQRANSDLDTGDIEVIVT